MWCLQPLVLDLRCRTVLSMSLRTSSYNLSALAHSVEADYTRKEELGSGAYGCVWRVKHNESGLTFALKQMDARVKDENKPRGVSHEITMQRTAGIQCKNIVRIYHVIVNPEGPMFNIYADLFRGGDLVDSLNRMSSSGKNLKDAQAAFLTQQAMTAVQHIHNLRIVHRDVKVENFVADRKDVTDPEVLIALTDFGFALLLSPGETTNDVAGTVPYFAPEVFYGKSGHKVDVWAVGVMAYVFTALRNPFPEKSNAAKARICHADGPQYQWVSGMSHECKAFIVQCFEPHPDNRWDATTALKHPWVTKKASTRNFDTSGGCCIGMARQLGRICCCEPCGGSRFVES